eukprot:TRINITY_DN12205_c0_g2_i1.p1 TRINITY_DN12205_c0_g2~~TRINITY_DN12205_c0_g2_i1.p1  ORF type:complete len:347 (-),score=62.48 TRINITY_DN12205_c0_g2_i1:111-1151(-)
MYSVKLNLMVGYTIVNESSSVSIIYSRSKDLAILSFTPFNIMKIVKKNEEGMDCLVENEETKELFHMKTMCYNKACVENVVIEINKNKGNPFLMQPEIVFKAVMTVYFLSKFKIDRTLAQLLAEQKVFNERKAKFYGYQIALALNGLHSSGVIYNGLTTRDVFTASDGYICLNDITLYRLLPIDKKDSYTASQVINNPYKILYCSPDHFLKKGITSAIGWWSLGIIMYELLLGIPPFYAEDRKLLEQKICCQPLRFPSAIDYHLLITDAARDLISKLLAKTRRLGEDVIEHKFFAVKEWDKERMLRKEADVGCVALGLSKKEGEEPVSSLYPQVTRKEVYKIFQLL